MIKSGPSAGGTNSFVSKNVDLIMANATPAVQAAATATGDIPILGTSVTEYSLASAAVWQTAATSLESVRRIHHL